MDKQSIDAPDALRPAGALQLVADVGGTHARLALARREDGRGRVVAGSVRRYVCADWPSLEAIIGDYLANRPEAGGAQGLICAIAGYLQQGIVINRNLAWPVTSAGLQSCGVGGPVRIVNDFDAMAYASLDLEPAARVALLQPQRPAEQPDGPRIVLGPGTGLGSAILIQGRAGVQVLPTEAGQIAMAPASGRELQVFEYFARRQAYVPVEQILSGPGLLALYQALCNLDGQTPVAADPAAVSRHARDGSDARALEAMDIFCGQLGSLAADLAILTGATGGIYLGGGFVPELLPLLETSSFRSRFFNKGVMQGLLQQIPVWGLLPGEHGLNGAAVLAGLAAD